MNERALKQLFDDLGRSLDRLAEALRVAAAEPLAIDGTIQRFELTFELFWKLMRRLLARQGVESNSPKAVPQQAYRVGWLDDEQRRLHLFEDRNLTSHTHREALAREIYGRIPAHHAAIRDVVQKLHATSWTIVPLGPLACPARSPAQPPIDGTLGVVGRESGLVRADRAGLGVRAAVGRDVAATAAGRLRSELLQPKLL